MLTTEIRVSRRSFLAGAAAASAAVAAGYPSPAAAKTVPRREERRRVVVLGSGFGGAITTMRLTEAGIPVTLIERGQRWPVGKANAFPTVAKLDRRVTWMRSTGSIWPGVVPPSTGTGYPGLVEFINGRGMDVACPAAYGGGSVPYHGMSVQPRGDLFDRVMPGALDYEEFDRVFYPRVGGVLKISTMPDDVLASDRYASSRRFQEWVRKAGLPAAGPVPMTVDWNIVRLELAGELPPLFSTGDVGLGVNGPGKHSLDTNYLPRAEATGKVEIKVLHDVKSIARDARGRWVLEIERIDMRGRVVERITLTTDVLFMGAGSPNTTKLLVRAGARGDITDLPDDLGGHYSGNGDLINAHILKDPTGLWQGGPANIASRDWDNPEGPATLLFAPVPQAVDLHVLMTIGMFIPDRFGRWEYDARRDEAILSYPGSLRSEIASSAQRRLNRVARAAGAVATLDVTRLNPVTFHSLGGAVLGKVTDDYGRVLGQRGLYVVDGALIPGSTACANPSLTIAALAERNVAHVLRNDSSALTG